MTGTSPDLVRQVEGALRARGRRRAIVRWTARAAVSATIVSGALGLFWVVNSRHIAAVGVTAVATEPRRDGQRSTARAATLLSFLDSDDEGRSTPRNRPVNEGENVVAPQSRAVRIGTVDGTELTLEPGGEVTVAEGGVVKRFVLTRGAIQARVRKLMGAERFLVQTADVEVEVHGTAFRVVLVPGGLSCANTAAKTAATHVSVSEGVVTVSGSGVDERLLPGDEWTSSCPDERRPAGAGAGATEGLAKANPINRISKVDEMAKISASRTSSASHGRGTGPGSLRVSKGPRAMASAVATGGRRRMAARSSSSGLEAQNDLFTVAVREKRAARTHEALAVFDRFIRTYPDSPLFESALAQRMRLLVIVDRQAAVEAAADYLARFPDGFARGEARMLLSSPPPS